MYSVCPCVELPDCTSGKKSTKMFQVPSNQHSILEAMANLYPLESVFFYSSASFLKGKLFQDMPLDNLRVHKLNMWHVEFSQCLFWQNGKKRPGYAH